MAELKDVAMQIEQSNHHPHVLIIRGNLRISSSQRQWYLPWKAIAPCHRVTSRRQPWPPRPEHLARPARQRPNKLLFGFSAVNQVNLFVRMTEI
jgi:hypothetical protein